MDDLVEKIRKSMRIKHTALDLDIISNIETAAADFVRVGVNPYSDDQKTIKEDALIEKAMELYCKAQTDFMGKGSQFEASYEKLRDAISLCGDYIEQ